MKRTQMHEAGYPQFHLLILLLNVFNSFSLLFLSEVAVAAALLPQVKTHII